MRKIILVFIFSSICFAQNNISIRRDGNWWQQEDEVQKYSYVLGFFDGMPLGGNFAWWDLKDKDGNYPTYLNKIYDSFEKYNKYFINVSNSQIVDGLDTFYSDYRNKKIRIKDAIWIVVNSIAGKSPEEIEKLTQDFRKNTD